ncbi:TetR-like C-terminal domain-containing protein [Streptomyces sp. L7]
MPRWRRGILDAVWEELAEVGYARLTRGGCRVPAPKAEEAGPLRRRWRNRAELVKAALPHRTGTIADRIPDTGELREDVLAVLRPMVDRQREIGPDVVRGLLAEAPDLDPRVFGIMHDILGTLLRRAVGRGEIPTADLPRRVVTLPAQLLRYEMVLSRDPVEDRALVEIVDEVFLPLVTGHG